MATERSKTAAQHLWPNLPSTAKAAQPSWAGRERGESLAAGIFPHLTDEARRGPKAKRVWSDRESLLRLLRKANERPCKGAGAMTLVRRLIVVKPLTWADLKPKPLRLTEWEREKLKEKLLSNYAEVDGDYVTPCWKWLLALGGSNNYGRCRWNGHEHQAHRLSWLCHFGDIPEDILVCHHCDNSWCIRPDHLFLGTSLQNTADMIAKGRDSFGWMSRGENNGHTHLTDEQVLDIRRKCVAGLTHDEIAEQYQVGRKTVDDINNGTRWAHLLPRDCEPAPKSEAFGERAGAAKLTEDQARQVRKLALGGVFTLQQIGEMDENWIAGSSRKCRTRQSQTRWHSVPGWERK